MILKKIVSITVLLIITGGYILEAQINEGNPIAGGMRYYLSPEDIQIYVSKSKTDKGEAALQLGHHYRYADGDLLRAYYWYERGIQAGHIGCIYEFGVMFMSTSNETRRTVALKYFNRLQQKAISGNEYAIELIGRLSNEYIEAARNFNSIPVEQKKEAEEYLEKILEKARKIVEEGDCPPLGNLGSFWEE